MSTSFEVSNETLRNMEEIARGCSLWGKECCATCDGYSQCHAIARFANLIEYKASVKKDFDPGNIAMACEFEKWSSKRICEQAV